MCHRHRDGPGRETPQLQLSDNYMYVVAINQIFSNMIKKEWFWFFTLIAINRKLQLTGLQLSGDHCIANMLYNAYLYKTFIVYVKTKSCAQGLIKAKLALRT